MNASQTCSGQVDAPAHLFFIVAHSLVFLVGLFLNGFTLRFYFFQAQQPAPSSVTVYLKNLAVADFLVSLCLPLRIANYASSSIAVRQVYCNFGASAFYLNMYASILFMGFVAANRYLKIVRPAGTHVLQTVRAARGIATVTWAFLLAIMTTYIALSLASREPLPPAPGPVSCDALHSKQLNLFYKVIHACTAAVFLLVLASLAFFYYRTSCRLSQAQQKQLASSGSKKLAKSRRNMSVLVTVFAVCFVPYHLVRLPYMFLWRRCSWNQAFFYAKELTVLMSVLNVCLDPIIYFIFCKAFRARLRPRRVFSATQEATRGDDADKRSSRWTSPNVHLSRLNLQ
ncbi:P2Y purinoceptor 14-like [Brachionichthys hirsutus]|uniref:P2Y purinoceptor 14-like n=1 Tax=Brachionichthys hirsutus TaxID=412623 RepID=UPI003604A045